MHIIIPVWFYGFDSAMYFVSSIVGFLLSFYFYKIYSLSSDKKHSYLYLGFLLLSIGLLSLAITDLYSYIAFSNCHASCILGIIDDVFSLEDFAYLAYFGLSLMAYILFILAYGSESPKFSKGMLLFFVLYVILIAKFVPISGECNVWESYHGYFHLTSMIMLIFVSFRNVANYFEKKSLNSLLVMNAFIFISLFHVFHLFVFISGWMYVFAHISMLIGFSSLLLMVLRLKK